MFFYFRIFSFANLSINCFAPHSSKRTVAFLFGPMPSTFTTSPSPNFWCKTLMPCSISSGDAAEKSDTLLLDTVFGVFVIFLVLLLI